MPSTATASSRFNALHEELLAQVLSYASARDVEAMAVASKFVAHGVLPRFPIWKEIFLYRWEMLNFALHGVKEGEVTLEIDERVKMLFPSTCSESRMYQLLAHAVTPVPSYADVRATNRLRMASRMLHHVDTLGGAKRRQVMDFAFSGRFLGGDRCVRSNVPFPTTFHVAVYARTLPNKQKTFVIGVTASGYYEISISKRPRQAADSVSGSRRYHGSDMTSVGIATSRFPLLDKQPGWDSHSIGYHGDDGRLFRRQSHGRPYAASFGPGDTIGCGVWRYPRAAESSVYFTNNGEPVPDGDRDIECDHIPWYPVVGLDSFDAIHINFGQEPFKFDDVVDMMFDECEGESALLATQLQWYTISESDVESSDDDSLDISESEDGEDMEVPYEMIEEHFERFEDDEWLPDSDSDGNEDYDGEEDMEGDVELETEEEGDGAIGPRRIRRRRMTADAVVTTPNYEQFVSQVSRSAD